MIVLGIKENKGIAYFIYEHDLPIKRVGVSNNKFAGQKAEDLPFKCVSLRFEGKEALKSIDIMLEDLQKIRENLITEVENEN